MDLSRSSTGRFHFRNSAVKEITHYFNMFIYRGSYMSAHVLLNLLNKLSKSCKMLGLPSIISLFRNKSNNFNNTRARMLD